MSSGLALEVKGANGGRWKRYPAYMDSGIDWVGEVPEHWGASKIIRHAYLKTGGTPDRNNVAYWENGTINWMSSGEVNKKKIFETNNKITPDGLANSNAMILPIDSIMVALNGQGKTKGTVAILKIESSCNQSLAAFICDEKKLHFNYLFYYLESKYKELRGLVGDGLRDGLSLGHLKNIYSPLPPIFEQRAIAAFLDRETGRIDTLIEKKERQVELLQEKRAALISHAVTKGLDPDVNMKDSGVEWLGEVPEEWEIIRVKLLEGNDSSVVQTGPFGAQLHASDYLDEGVPLILIRNVHDLKIDETDIPRISKDDAERLSMYQLNIGDIVFSRVGSIGRIALCTEREKGWLISGQMLRLRIQNPMLDSRFSLYAFSSKSLLTFVELQSVGSTRESINTDILRNMPILIPPQPEQRTIAAFLYRETGRIDSLIEKIIRSIEKLREYRISIISAAVTGKINVLKEMSHEP